MFGPRNGNINPDDEDDDYQDDSMEIHAELFAKDLDDVGYDPIVDDDADDEAAEMFDY